MKESTKVWRVLCKLYLEGSDLRDDISYYEPDHIQRGQIVDNWCHETAEQLKMPVDEVFRIMDMSLKDALDAIYNGDV